MWTQQDQQLHGQELSAGSADVRMFMYTGEEQGWFTTMQVSWSPYEDTIFASLLHDTVTLYEVENTAERLFNAQSIYECFSS